MKKPATHEGTCQACFREQKLPGGLLSKHGYQVIDRGMGGWFSGTCRGSDHKPFEETCELTKRLIVEAEEYRDKLLATAEAHREKPTPEEVRINHKFGGHYALSIEAVCTIVRLEGGCVYYVINSEKERATPEKPAQEYRYPFCGYGDDPARAAARFNNQFAEKKDYEAKNLAHHITRMKERVEDWKPAKLKEVKP